MNIGPLRMAGIFLGIGLGGFIDGILLHQILQLHNMLSNRLFPDTVVNTDINMFWDGIFHAFTWICTAVGLWRLWRVAQRRSSPLDTRVFCGSMLLGWGLFNFIEGIVNHQLLGLHHVVQRSTGEERLFWDLSFLASGLLFMAVGQVLIRKGKAALRYKGRDATSTARIAS